MTRRAASLEVHGHSWITGPHANHGLRIEHSHQEGSYSHRHPDTGPAGFTIDKDEWYAATGMRGGGRKRYTPRPIGQQLEWIEPEHRTFKVVFVDNGYTAEHARAGSEKTTGAPLVTSSEQLHEGRRSNHPVMAEQRSHVSHWAPACYRSTSTRRRTDRHTVQ